ncbi:MAG: restriction endonuclease [Saprospiraceae bacterium]|nr:restriction endonuclease [Saprospiraceae bacterium]
MPFNKIEIKKSIEYFRQEAMINRAREFTLVKRISNLPLSGIFGNKIDLKDLAVSFLTYASAEKLGTFKLDRVKKIYEYLNIPEQYYLNVYDLFYGLKNLDISYEDLIINLSRLRLNLSIPSGTSSISVLYSNIFDKVYDKLPYSLNKLTGEQLEDFVMGVYDKAGFNVLRIGRNSFIPDGGIDIIAYTKRPLEGDIKYVIQCKAWKEKIDVSLIRSFNTSLLNYNANKGIYIAKNGFTKDSIEETVSLQYKIELMDYIKLSNQLRTIIEKD